MWNFEDSSCAVNTSLRCRAANKMGWSTALFGGAHGPYVTMMDLSDLGQAGGGNLAHCLCRRLRETHKGTYGPSRAATPRTGNDRYANRQVD